MATMPFPGWFGPPAAPQQPPQMPPPAIPSLKGMMPRVGGFFRDNPATIWTIAAALLNNKGTIGDLSGLPAAAMADASNKKASRKEMALAEWAKANPGTIPAELVPFLTPEVMGGVAGKMVENKLLPPSPKEGFTLSPDQTRYDAYGNPVVRAPSAPGNMGPHPPGGPLTAAEKSAYGFKPDEQVFWDDKGIGPSKLPGTNVNISNNLGPTGIDYGMPEKGLVWQRNPDGSVALDDRGAPVAIPYKGGPVATAEEEARTKAAAAATQRSTYADVVTQDIDRAKTVISTSRVPVTGFGALLSGIPGTDANRVANALATIKANIGFDRLQQMRDSSPTGGALGQVSEMENRLLQSVYGSLEQSQTKEDLVYNLDRIRAIYTKIINEGIKPGDPIIKDLGLSDVAGGSSAPGGGNYIWTPDKGLQPAQ